MSHRPLVLVPGLTLGDYLLWNWSLGGGHDAIAIVSGFSLLPLVLATAWLFALALARVLSRGARTRSRDIGRPAPPARATPSPVPPLLADGPLAEANGRTAHAKAAASSGKLAA